MKKLIMIIGVLLLSVNSVNALTLNEDGSYTNKKGAIITPEQYEILQTMMTTRTMENLSQNAVRGFTDPNNTKKPVDQYYITTNYLNRIGEVINSITIEATEEEALAVAQNENLHVLYDEKLHDISKETVIMPRDAWEVKTDSKNIKMSYYPEGNGGATAYMEVKWKTVPKIKKYDILALRWETSRSKSNIYEYSAYVISTGKDGSWLGENYELGDSNLNITEKGMAQIVDIPDGTVGDLELGLYIEADKDLGEWLYATYQHARHSSITLTRAKSYTFSANGLGGVLYFSNTTTRGYYDGMAGIKDDLSSGAHFIY